MTARAVEGLVAKWRKLADAFAENGNDISRAEAASMRNDASELEQALAADRAAQGEMPELHPAQKALRKIRAASNHPGTEATHGSQYANGMRRAANMLEEALSRGECARTYAAHSRDGEGACADVPCPKCAHRIDRDWCRECDGTALVPPDHDWSAPHPDSRLPGEWFRTCKKCGIEDDVRAPCTAPPTPTSAGSPLAAAVDSRSGERRTTRPSVLRRWPMRERPILFSGAMVRAILEGRKTQTRRVVKPAPDLVTDDGVPARFTTRDAELGRFGEVIRCPYGQPGDRLWVRETFMVEPHPADVGITREMIPRTWDSAVAAAGTVHYAADPGAEIRADGRPWKPSIHMPRRACRLVLEITDVRVERLQAISEIDAEAEGVFRVDIDPGYPAKFGANPFTWAEAVEQQADCHDFAALAFRDLWKQINGQASWDANPWVWVVGFRRIEA